LFPTRRSSDLPNLLEHIVGLSHKEYSYLHLERAVCTNHTYGVLPAAKPFYEALHTDVTTVIFRLQRPLNYHTLVQVYDYCQEKMICSNCICEPSHKSYSFLYSL